MKKIVCIAVLMLSTGSVFAQLYLRGNIGYNLPANSQLIGVSEAYHAAEDSRTFKGVYGSFGSGFSIHAAVGGSISGTLGYDVEIGYLLGKRYTVDTLYEATNDIFNELTSYEQYTRSFQITPSLTFTSGTGSIQPYARIGPVLSLTYMRGETTHDYTDYYEAGTFDVVHEVYEHKLDATLSLGFKGTAGVSYELNDKLQLFSEITFISLSYSPKKEKIELVEYTFEMFGTEHDREDIPADQKSREIEYKKEVHENEPNVKLQEKFSMGNFGFQVGVKYLLK